MQIQGKITKVGKVQQVSDKFKKREVWIETERESNYPQEISVQISQDKADQFNRSVGEEVELDINLRGRRWTNKEGVEMIFNTIDCWRWQLLNQSTPENSNPKPPQNDEDDDLPF